MYKVLPYKHDRKLITSVYEHKRWNGEVSVWVWIVKGDNRGVYVD